MDNKTKKDVLDIMDDMNSDDYISMYYDQEEHEEKLKRALIYDAKQEGKRIGEKDKQLEIAKKMLEKGLDTDFIIECTGLTKEELENLN